MVCDRSVTATIDFGQVAHTFGNIKLNVQASPYPIQKMDCACKASILEASLIPL